VPIERIRVSPLTQRDLRSHFVDYLASEFDPDELGYPVMSFRDGWYYVIDGQHRVAALRAMGWNDQMIECEVREGLSEQEEAEMFLRRNDRLNVSPNDKFKVAVQAGRVPENEIARICFENGYAVPVAGSTGSNGDEATDITHIRCLAALRRIWDENGSEGLDRVLKFINLAYGKEPAGNIVAGFGLLMNRYGDALVDEEAARKLGSARGGARGLLQRAEGIRRATGRPKAQSVAAAAVDVINSGRGGHRLPNWWAA